MDLVKGWPSSATHTKPMSKLCVPYRTFSREALYAAKLVGERETRLGAVTAAISVSQPHPAKCRHASRRGLEISFEPGHCLVEAATHSAFSPTIERGLSRVRNRLSGGQGEERDIPGLSRWICGPVDP